jgi:hypothetical protein
MNVRNCTMSIRCSLLGHSYGEAEIEREREEQGSEVVVTVREFEECERCGDRKIVTENKEVTALQSPAPDLESAESGSENVSQADAASATPDATGGAETVAATDAEVTAAAGEDDAEIMTDSTDSGGASASASDSTGSSSDTSASDPETARSNAAEAATETDSADGDFEQGPSAAEDDGVILDDDDDDSTAGDRTPGEWPEAETTHPAETDESPGEWPAVGREDDDAGYDAEPGDSGNADVEFGGGLTPESAPEVDADEAEEVEFVNAEGDALQSKEAADGTTELSSGISAGADAPSVAGPTDDPHVDAEFVCPECDYREGVAGSSLRAGDICPECARGYLAQE